MKRVLYVVLALLLGAGPAFADISAQGGPIGSSESGSDTKTVTVTSSTSSAGTFATGGQILGLKIIATSANGVCGLFDAATIGAASASNMIDELREATANETSVQLWPNPFVLVTDLSIGVSNATCIVYYR